MVRTILLATLAFGLTLVAVAPINATNETAAVRANGMYVEARTTDIWTGPCFANADFNIGGKQGIMAWRIEQGQAGDVSLDGLSVVAVVSAANTLGLDQRSPAKAFIIVDSKANATQRDALVRFAQQQGGQLLEKVVKVETASIEIIGCPCKKNACFEVNATIAKVKTRCLDGDHDKVCGNEIAFFPPLVNNVKANPAAVVEHSFSGTGLGATWSDGDRRGAYVGSFEVK